MLTAHFRITSYNVCYTKLLRDEVELFVNGVSQGRKSKEKDQFHVMWRVPFHAGSIRAVSYKNGEQRNNFV